MLDSLDKSFNCSFPPKEKWSVFLPKVQKPSVRADRGTNRIILLLEVWAGRFPVSGFDQNFYSSIERLVRRSTQVN